MQHPVDWPHSLKLGVYDFPGIDTMLIHDYCFSCVALPALSDPAWRLKKSLKQRREVPILTFRHVDDAPSALQANPPESLETNFETRNAEGI